MISGDTRNTGLCHLLLGQPKNCEISYYLTQLLSGRRNFHTTDRHANTEELSPDNAGRWGCAGHNYRVLED